MNTFRLLKLKWLDNETAATRQSWAFVCLCQSYSKEASGYGSEEDSTEAFGSATLSHGI